jgi:protein SCO1/2
VPADGLFRDETGKTVALRQYLGKPVILNLVYYQCPTLCSQTLNGLTRSMKPLSLEPGKDFNVVTVSIDPTETPELARRKRKAYLKRLDRPGAERGWHFLTGEEPAIRALADSVGFRYSYNPRTKLYAHAVGIVILTPNGEVARYLYGIDFPPKELQFALTEASAGKIGSPIARVLLLCYDYDAATGRYTLAIVRLIRVFGIITALAVGFYVGVMLLRERRSGGVAAIGETLANA